MGRQIAIAATAADEEAFLAYLRETAEIRLFRSHVPSEEELWVDRFLPFQPEDTQYFIWNTRYAWKPRIRSTLDGDSFYIENAVQGPVIEFDRTNADAFVVNPLCHSRIYWAGYNRQKGFIAWFDGILRWIRQGGRGLKVYSSNVYCLPDLWRRLQAQHAGVTSWDGQWRRAADVIAQESAPTVRRRRSLAKTWEHLESQGETMPRDDRGRPFVPPQTPNYDDEEDELGFSFFRHVVEGADYSQLTLPRTFFGRSELERVSFYNTDLSGARMCWNDFIECDFRRANLSGCDLRASVFKDCNFDGASLTGADLRRATFEGCTFQWAKLGEAIADDSAAYWLLAALSARQRDSIVWHEDPGPLPDGG